MSDVIAIDTPGGGYDVVVGEGTLERTGELYTKIAASGRVAVITDTTVEKLYADRVVDSLRDAGVTVDIVSIPAGEQSKNWIQAGAVLERLASIGLDRASGIVAVGGGVVGDLAGFCAAVYMRGVAFVQVPTTLLAQVDSSVGGKTAVDLEAGKNLAGAFIQPRLVVADTAVMDTLSDAEWRSGLAEVAKSGILDSEQLMTWMERNATALLRRDPGAVQEAVRACVVFKGRVVASDEREMGARESLNYGHTLGHALEKVLGYGTVPHGIAVADGIRFAAHLAERVAGVSPHFSARQEALLDSLDLPVLSATVDPDAVRAAIYADKKVRGGQARFVLVTEPGSFVVAQVDDDTLASELATWAGARKGAGT